MKRRRPCFHLIAGPNGAGKTTFAREYLPNIAGTFEFLNADLIAAGLSPLRPQAAAISAGRILLQEFERLARSRVDFAVESTLAGSTLVSRLRGLRAAGYRLYLYYLWLPRTDLALARVRARVQMGGHDVPPDAVERRFHVGLRNLRELYLEVFDEASVIENSLESPRVVAERRSRRWRVRVPGLWKEWQEALRRGG